MEWESNAPGEEQIAEGCFDSPFLTGLTLSSQLFLAFNIADATTVTVSLLKSGEMLS